MKDHDTLLIVVMIAFVCWFTLVGAHHIPTSPKPTMNVYKLYTWEWQPQPFFAGKWVPTITEDGRRNVFDHANYKKSKVKTAPQGTGIADRRSTP